MSKKIKVKEALEEIVVEDDVSLESDEEEIELKPKKERKPYVLTDKRKEQFDKARQKRMENIQERKKLEEEKKIEQLNMKKELEVLKEEKIKKRVSNQIQKIKKEIEEVDELEIIHKPKPKKKVIYVESESDDDIQVMKTKKKPEPREIKPLIRYF